jgi:SnoaL-like domain
MTENESIGVYEAYFAAFGETSPVKREELLRSVVAEDVSFSNPGVSGEGIDTLLAHISGFQEHFPGGHFRINWVRQQNGQILGEWTQLAMDGSEIVTAHSYAQLNDDGRIGRFAGFWEPF